MTSRSWVAPAALVFGIAAWLPAPAIAQTAGGWEYTASLNLWLPSLKATTVFPPPATGGSDASVDAGKLLDALQFTFMGSFEARQGNWGAYTDVVYLDLSADKSGSRDLSLGGVGLPAGVAADLRMDLGGWSWTLGGAYRTASTPDMVFDVVAGARLLDVTQKLKWTLTGNIASVPLPDRTGDREANVKNWDAVVGIKGRFLFGEGRKWSAPFYLDVGTGDSDLTTQAMVGIGYSFGWGGLLGSWRYLDYNFKSGKALQDLNFSGPMVSAVFRW